MEERVCLKCGMMASIDTSKSKVFCRHCGNLIYENDGNGGYLKVKRANHYFYCVVALDVYVDGVKMSSISNGNEAIIPIPFGIHEVYVRYSTSGKSELYRINLSKENNTEILYVSPGYWIKPKTKLREDFTKQEKNSGLILYIVICLLIFFFFFMFGFLFS